MTYKVFITPTALYCLKNIEDRRIQKKIAEDIDGLKENPEFQGKPLTATLAGYRSLRSAGQRYRVIFRVVRDTIEVHIVYLGIRKDGSKKDVYQLAQKLIRLGLLGPKHGRNPKSSS